jgi:hypothetical protein
MVFVCLNGRTYQPLFHSFVAQSVENFHNSMEDRDDEEEEDQVNLMMFS